MIGTNNNWPDFLIAGTARSGTTALHEHLGKHPDIFMPLQKEPCFFTFYGDDPVFKDARHKYLTDESAYLGLASERGDKLWGESSTPYLYFPEKTIQNIQKLVPESRKIKIIIILRDPAERAYSQYMHNRRDLREPLTFEEAISQEKQRMDDNWHFDFFYVDKGLYFKQVNAYMKHFDHVHIIMFDDFEKDPSGVVKGVLDFLGLPDMKDMGVVQKRNQSGEMKIKWLKRMMSNRENPVLNAIRRLMSKKTRKKLRNLMKNQLLKHNLKTVEMSAETRQMLVNYYREDTSSLASLIKKDLSSWQR